MVDSVDSTSTRIAKTASSHETDRPVSIVRRFLELIRFSHTIFALPFAGLACVFALAAEPVAKLPTVTLTLRLLGVLACMVTARAAAMAFNRLVDARIDARNPRTANRHLPAGLLSPTQVWLFFSATCLLFIFSCTLFLPNWMPLAGAIPVLLWICGYSFAKRFTSAAHLWLGFALALSPVCAWIAIRGEQVLMNFADLLPAACLATAIALWVAGFDIIYACQDTDFDRSHKLHSIPQRFGIAGALRIAAGMHLGMLLMLCCLPFFPQLHLGWLYWFGFVGVAGLVVTQHSLVRPTDLAKVNVAFFQVNAILSIGFCLLTAFDCWYVR